MKLITGFYPHKDVEYPIPSVEDEEAYSVIDRTNKPLTDFTALDLNMRTHDVRPIKYLLTPPDAYGFNVQLRSENEDIARVEQNLVLGIAPGDANIIVEVRNPDTLLTSAPDFTDTVTVRVADSIRTRIESVDLPASITLYTTESTTIYPDITPVNAGFYVDSWESDKPEFASVVSGFIRAHQPGTAIITYRITNNLEEETQTIEKQVFVNIKSPIAFRTIYEATAPAVGYMLSTPILYLLTSVGAPVFFNEMQTQDKMQCGTISMVLNNSYSSSFPIVAQQNSIVTRTPSLNRTASSRGHLSTSPHASPSRSSTPTCARSSSSTPCTSPSVLSLRWKTRPCSLYRRPDTPFWRSRKHVRTQASHSLLRERRIGQGPTGPEHQHHAQTRAHTEPG